MRAVKRRELDGVPNKEDGLRRASRALASSLTKEGPPTPPGTTAATVSRSGGLLAYGDASSAHNVVADKVLVAFVRVNLHAPAVDVAGRVG